MNHVKAGLAAALALFVTQVQTTRPADACGVHLIVKSPSPRQSVARTAHPQDILLVGTPSQRLQRDLTARGHNVEVAPSAKTAKLGKYAAVMTDASHFAEAKVKYGTNVFLYRDFATDTQNIEGVVARAPSGAKTKRTVIIAKHDGVLVNAGGGKTSLPGPKATGGGGGEAIASDVKQHEETHAARPMPSGKLDGEMFFGLGSVSISRRTAITSAVAWLAADNSRSIVISGYADPTGTAEANLALSQSRADAVKDALVGEGIDSSRIEVHAFGDTHLKYGRSDARNRRVSIEGKQGK